MSTSQGKTWFAEMRAAIQENTNQPTSGVVKPAPTEEKIPWWKKLPDRKLELEDGIRMPYRDD